MSRPRGRPKNSDIPFLIEQGKNSQSKIKCRVCFRDFARTKSLKTHMAVHGIYEETISVKGIHNCNYPECTESFKQTSHLYTHFYRHSMEEPFKCVVDGCSVRFRHGNRECPVHNSVHNKCYRVPESTEEVRAKFFSKTKNPSQIEIDWFEEYLLKREEKMKPRVQTREKRKLDFVEDVHEEISNKKICKETEVKEDCQENSSSCDGSTIFLKREKKPNLQRKRKINLVKDVQEESDKENICKETEVKEDCQEVSNSCDGSTIFLKREPNRKRKINLVKDVKEDCQENSNHDGAIELMLFIETVLKNGVNSKKLFFSRISRYRKLMQVNKPPKIFSGLSRYTTPVLNLEF